MRNYSSLVHCLPPLIRTSLQTLLTAFLLLSVLPASAANLHVIMAIDSNDGSIGVSVDNDRKHYQEFVRRIAEYTDMELVEKIFAGDDFISDAVYDYIKTLHVDADDSVIFYYSGHGYRTAAKVTPWPVMHFGYHQLGLDLQDVADRILEHAPRFALVMSDTCNGVESEQWVPDWQRDLVATRVSETKLRANYRRLFLDENIMIVTTSSEPGQYSFGPDSGGVYTNSFLKSVYFEVKKSNAGWERLLERAQKKADKIEHPLFEIIALDM